MAFEWPQISRQFQELKGRRLSSAEDLQKWLADQDELDSVLYEQKALRLINVSRQTDSPDYKSAYSDFIQNLEPRMKAARFEILKKYIESPHRKELPQRSYGTMDRRRSNEASLFRPENIELEKQDAQLAEVYRTITGGMTVRFRGEERTMQQMAALNLNTDRAVREEAWRLREGRRLEDSERLDSIYSEMVKVREKAAKNAGFANFRDYAFKKRERFDYTPDDCFKFFDAVEKNFVPLSRRLDKKRMETMGLDELRPWDLEADPRGRPPLTPFADAAELVGCCSRVFAKVDPQLSGYFRTMSQLGLFDLESRKGKAPGGFQEDLSETRLPFIFMNAAKRDSDVRILLHESGHSFHTFLMREARLPFYNSAQNVPPEFGEVASTSMELIGGEHLGGTVYSAEEAQRSNEDAARSFVKLFGWISTIDSFQHWVYTHAGHTPEERADAWAAAFRRFGGLESYEGLDRELRYMWHRQLHLFEVPFYYFEYGIATLGALGIWVRYRKDPEGALASYKHALSLGGSRPLPELFEAAGLPWDFGAGTVARLSRELESALPNLN
jgi:oligoendopeptidase F